MVDFDNLRSTESLKKERNELLGLLKSSKSMGQTEIMRTAERLNRLDELLDARDALTHKHNQIKPKQRPGGEEDPF